MGPKLLIVDDDPPQMAMIVRAAREAGFTDLVRAASAAEADDHLENDAFQVAVVDLVLTMSGTDGDYPEDGLEVIQAVRRAQPECRIIALTTKLDTEAGIRAMNAGADDFISSKWLRINWEELLVQRLRLWRGVVEGRGKALASL